MAVNYVEKAKGLEWPQLRVLWHEIKERVTPGWPPGKAFEHLILRAFELNNADVRWPYSVVMNGQVVEQIDGMIFVEHVACLVECKDTDSPINVEPLAKLRNQILRRHSGVIGAVFSVSGFTDPAQTLAQYLAPQAIMLWKGEEVDDVLTKQAFSHAFLVKYRYMMQNGIADYDIRTDEMP